MHPQLNVKMVLFQIIQFSISTQFSSIWIIDRTLSGASSSGQSGAGSDGNEGVLHILQNSSITGTSPSDCLVSYPGHLFSYPSAEMQCILQPQLTGQYQWIRYSFINNKHTCAKYLIEFLSPFWSFVQRIHLWIMWINLIIICI